ncbi:hypothetical protein DACRYDRAFT_109427 [Dacryopinax primogenitus]|uniref:Uncharacterized protein n=1 Tax=Dacryopinax primogenitus (strain DJM 731) TaxID=1858805 RepID=M5G2A3_DACPD|nr:uncharacterized protein DACRYDRAFT_109427 [Dacryopinax primogenitus]EJU00002.1 hypothetical protein DACRYDRAFT_109427 [Dacryopinax primogenitus]
MSRPHRRPPQSSANEAYRRALLLPVQPWKKEWVTPVGGSPGLKLMKWVKSDEKLQWSDDEDDTALEQALGAAADHGVAGEGADEAGSSEDEESREPDEGDSTPIDGGSFPASGIQTPKEIRPHPLRKELKPETEEEEEEEGEEPEEGEEAEADDEEEPEKDEKQGAEVEEGEEGEGEEDADLNVPQTDGDYDATSGPGFPHEEGTDDMMGEGYDGQPYGHMTLEQIAEVGLMEGEEVVNHEGGIEEASGQQPLGLVNADNPDESYV